MIVQIVVSQKSCHKTGTEEKGSNAESDSNSTEKSSDSNSTEEKTSNAEKSNESDRSSVSKSETDSVYEVPVKKQQIPVLELDNSDSSIALFEKDKSDDNNDDSSVKMDSTTKIYKKFMEGNTSRISLPNVSSTLSTVLYSDSSNDVKVVETDDEDLKKKSSKTDIKVPETDVKVPETDVKVPETDDEDLKKNSSKKT